MSEPLTLSVLGTWAAGEGIKFLYGQAAELLKAWRERRRRAEAGETLPAQLAVPIVETDVLDGVPAEPVADATVVDREHASLVRLIGALAPYAQGLADVDLADDELADHAGRLRTLLESAYGQRFTFHGENRDPTGTRVSVKQVLGDVEGSVVGAEADVAPGGEVAVDQSVHAVKPEGSIHGFKGRIG